jgi:hypothetical protein
VIASQPGRVHGGNLDIRELTTGKYFAFVTRLKRRVLLVEQELLTLPGHLSPPRVSVRFVLLDLLFCACYLDRCLAFCTFSFGHCVVCSSIYDF